MKIITRSLLSRSILLGSFVFATALSAQTTQLTPAADTANPNQQFTRMAQPSGVAISPDGALVTYMVGGRRGGALHVVTVADPTNDKALKPAGPTGCASSDPVWSPDSQTLALVSTCVADGKAGQEQIVLWSKATGAFKTITHVTGNIQQPAWSPDGKYLSFLFVENATRSAGALDAMKPWDGVIGEDGVEIQRVAATEVSSGAFRFLTQRDLHVYEFTWSPNSKEIAYIGANPPGENTWWIAKLYVKNAGSGGSDARAAARAAACPQGKSGVSEVHCVSTDDSDIALPRIILDPVTVSGALHGLQIAVPRYSPDGTKIAFIGGLMSDQGSTGGDVWVVPAKGGEPTDITPGIDGTPCFEAWLNDNRIGIVEDRRGRTHLPDYDVAKRAYIEGSDIDLGEVTVSGGAIKDAVSISLASGSLAFVEAGASQPAEVYLLNGLTGKLKPITRLNAAFKSTGPKFESVEWENEGFHVQGWLTYPKNYDPAKKYPILTVVHGGPSASAGPRADTAWSDQGYFVFSPNPRGSFGQGEKFVQANRKDFGYGDLRDILKGLDMLEAKFPIDKHREGLTGWSYGGFMSMFAETQTTRFAAIVAGAGISNWQSYYGENSIDQWMVPFFGATVYDDPKVYAKSSAIEFIKNAKTPMLIIVGDRDGECPAPQSFEMWHALKAEGVKTQLVIYPNEGHGFRDPAHIADRMAREVKWFAEYMPAKQ